MPYYQPGDVVLRDYKIETFIGEGGFGEVYRARDLHLREQIALKILRHTSSMDDAYYERAKQRFTLEALLGHHTNHPNVIRIYKFAPDETSGMLVLVMEYAPGGSLADRIKSGPLAVSDTLRIARQVAAGLGALHEQDVVHRDLKPSNILFDSTDTARVADLGLAQPASVIQVSVSSSGGGEWKTQPGTPAYMSPEQDSGRLHHLPPASDVYALGLIIFEMLTRRSYKNQLPGTRVSKLRPEVPVALDNLLVKMLSEDPRQRPWNGSAAEQALTELTTEAPAVTPSVIPTYSVHSLEDGVAALEGMIKAGEWEMAHETLVELEGEYPDSLRLKLPRRIITQALEDARVRREAAEQERRGAEARARRDAEDKAKRDAEAQAARQKTAPPAAPDWAERAQQADQRGTKAHNAGNFDLAIQEYSHSITLDPNAAKSYRNRGVSYHKKGDYDRAIADYNRAIELDPKVADYYRQRGVSYAWKNDNDRAIADYNRAIELAPKVADYYRQRGVSYHNKGDYDRAIADYNRAIELDPKVADYYRQRGVSYAEKKDHDRAIADKTRAIELDPQNGAYYYSRSLSYQAKGNVAQAAADQERARELGYTP